MKHLIFLAFLAVISTTLNAQTGRIKSLTTERVYDNNLMFVVDKSSYSAHRKIYASTIATYINNLGLTRDTVIWQRLTDLENNEVFEAGGNSSSVQQVSASDTAYGDYSLAHGYQTVASLQGSRAYSSGSVPAGTDGWGQCVEFTVYNNYIKAANSGTLLINNADSIFIANNHIYLTTVKIVGSAYNGVDKGLNYTGTYQFLIKNVAGTTTLAGVDTIAEYIEAGNTATVVFTANDATEELIITATSTDGGDMFWIAEIKMVMIKFD